MRINLDQKTVRLAPCSTKKGTLGGSCCRVLFFLNSLSSWRERLPLPGCLLYFRDSTLSIMLLLQRSFTTKGHKGPGFLLVC